MKKNKIVTIMFLIISLIFITGFAYATYYTSDDVRLPIKAASLDVSLIQTNNNQTYSDISEDGKIIGIDYQTVNPGAVIDESIAVRNNDNSVASYIRVKVERYWTNQNKEIINNLDLDSINIKNDNSDWIEIKNDLRSSYYYYKKPVAPGVTTSNLMSQFSVLENVSGNTNKYADCVPHIKFVGEGIQQVASKDAMKYVWDIDVVFDNNDNILEVKNS